MPTLVWQGGYGGSVRWLPEINLEELWDVFFAVHEIGLGEP